MIAVHRIALRARLRSARTLYGQALLWTALVLLASPAPAAEDEIDSARSGPFLGVSAGAALPNFAGEYFYTPPPFQARTAEDVSVEVLGRLGWRISPHFAIEGQYEWVREWEMTTKTATCAEADAQVFTGNLRVFAPFESVHPYAVAGAGAGRFRSHVIEAGFDSAGNRCTKTSRVDYREDDWDLAFRFGGGLDVYVTRHIIVNLEASTIYTPKKVFGETLPFVSISGGLGYRF